MNVEDWEAARCTRSSRAIAAEAEQRGREVRGSELVGLMPAGAAVAAAGAKLRIDGFDAVARARAAAPRRLARDPLAGAVDRALGEARAPRR